jgi:hypothetical protein
VVGWGASTYGVGMGAGVWGRQGYRGGAGVWVGIPVGYP